MTFCNCASAHSYIHSSADVFNPLIQGFALGGRSADHTATGWSVMACVHTNKSLPALLLRYSRSQFYQRGTAEAPADGYESEVHDVVTTLS